MSPFADVRGGSALALAYGLATVVWVVPGASLPGGRWLAVHLFTLGVVTNAIVAFSSHFGHTLTRTPTTGTSAPDLAVLNGFILLALVGTASRTTWAVAVGATGVSVQVARNYLDLRAARRASLGARFAWIVRLYERAHGNFLHGALLGALLGSGVLGGRWYAPARLAHLHVNVLGWGALTLLATLVFFGPTMVRQRIEDGADDRAARWLRRGATGIGVGALLLLATGLGGTWGTAARLAAAVGVGMFAWSATVVCVPVARVAWRAEAPGPRLLVLGAAAWLPLAVWADAIVVATGSWRYLDALGGVALGGVLAQAIVASLLYIGGVVASSDAARRRWRAATERAAPFLAAALNLLVIIWLAASWPR